jgi:iron complex outermembrane receptor protein
MLMSSGATMALAAAAQAQGAPATVLLETITVTAPAAPAASSSSPEGERSVNPPSFEAQQQRFERRPGAETVVSVSQREPGKLTSLNDVLDKTPGVFLSEGGNFISMRGSDISIDGSRNGRGVRAHLDGFPLGRTEAGFTGPLIDLLATDYLEVYRGGNSLRYGAIATGGALNFVSKTGRSAPGSALSVLGGSFGTFQTQLEHGGFKGAVDWYMQGNMSGTDGYRPHTGEHTYRFSGNVGWTPTLGVESRTFVAAGRANRDLAEPIPLDQLHALRRFAPPNSTLFNERLDFDYQRLANRTVIRDGDTTYELGGYLLNTTLDHIPSPFAGIIDYGWLEGGASGRIEHKTSLAGLPTELVGGVRVGYTAGAFDRYQHLNAGTTEGRQIYDWAFSSWLVESYGETAIEIAPRVRLFAGLQGVFTTRVLDDHYRGGAVAALGPTASGGPQPGRIAGLLEYDRDFQALNPKFGVNWEYLRDHFVFANVTRSYEVPSGADLSNVLETQGRTGRALPPIEAQSAWTWETGLRGGWARFKYDVTLYHMRLENEILTRCATEVSAACTTTIAFNADGTVHNGVELGLKAVPFVDVLRPGDSIFANAVWNYTDFRFDDDPRFGSQQMPVIPRHQLFGELGYQHPSGFYGSVNARHQGDRRATFDGSGGNAFIVPAYTLLGAKLGWRDPSGAWSVFVEGRNLTDVAYVSEFAATPTVPVTQQGPQLVRSTSPQVRPGDGRAVYAGMTVRF